MMSIQKKIIRNIFIDALKIEILESFLNIKQTKLSSVHRSMK